MAQIKTTIQIPEGFRPADREAIADAVVEFIRDRTTKLNLDKRNRPFPGYSDKYMDSLDFAIGGKSPGKVDLQLSGDMMASLQVLRTSPRDITIGFPAGDKAINGRAEGNIEGTYGQPRPIKGKKRDFLGITNKDLSNIVKRYEKVKDTTEDELPPSGDILDFVLSALLGRRKDKK